MQPDEPTSALLWDMHDAASAVRKFAAGRTMEQYLADELLQAAVERKIEIIGEAARKVARDFQQAHPEIPWAKIAGQRHVLAHDYGRIEHDRLWNVVTVHIPELITQLECLLQTGAD
jgi:uncharacterized protein with HEPN domain